MRRIIGAFKKANLPKPPIAFKKGKWSQNNFLSTLNCFQNDHDNDRLMSIRDNKATNLNNALNKISPLYLSTDFENDIDTLRIIFDLDFDQNYDFIIEQLAKFSTTLIKQVINENIDEADNLKHLASCIFASANRFAELSYFQDACRLYKICLDVPEMTVYINELEYLRILKILIICKDLDAINRIISRINFKYDPVFMISFVNNLEKILDAKQYKNVIKVTKQTLDLYSSSSMF